MTLTTETLYELYTQWLQGASLRGLAHQSGIRHSKLHSAFRKQFGEKATNTKATSLIRSVLVDYPNNEQVLTWALKHMNEAVLDESIKHRSEHSMQMLSSYQTLESPALMDTIAVGDDDVEQPVWDFLRLPYYRLLTDHLAKALVPHLGLFDDMAA